MTTKLQKTKTGGDAVLAPLVPLAPRNKENNETPERCIFGALDPDIVGGVDRPSFSFTLVRTVREGEWKQTMAPLPSLPGTGDALCVGLSSVLVATLA